MNKKILLSTAAAVVLAVGFTGCGSSGSSSGSSSSGTSTFIPADGYIYGATVTCENGTATVDKDDDNLTVTVNSSNPGLCTVTGGVDESGAANTATLKINVPADSNTTIFATPITTLLADGIALSDVLSTLGLSNTMTEAEVAAINPVSETSGLSVNARKKVVQLYTIMQNLSADDAKTVVKSLVESGTDIDADFNATVLSDALDGIDGNTTLTNTLISIDQQFATITNIGDAEAMANGIIGAFSKANLAEKLEDNNATIADLNTTITAKINEQQAALVVPYLGGINDDNNDTNGTYRLASDGNAVAVDANLTYANNTLPLLAFNLADQNVTDGNFTADISLLLQNEGNANYSMKTVLKDIAVVENGSNYIFTLANNTNVTVAGTNYTGVDFTSGTYNADCNVTHEDDNSTSEMNLMVGWGTDGKAIDTNATTGYTKFNIDRVTLWTEHKLGVDDDDEAELSNYGVNGNWSTKLLINLKDASGTVKLYKAQSDGKLSQAAKDSINVDGTTQTGAIIFNGRLVEQQP